MAEIISIHVKLASGSYQSIEKIDNLWKTVQKLNSTPITLSIETKAIDSATKKMLALATAQAKAEAEAWKAEQADIKRAAASEARAAKEAAAAEKRANAEKQAQDKKTQALIETARKAEDLADKEAKRKEQELIHMKKLILQEQQAYEKAQEAEAAAAAKAEQKKAAAQEKAAGSVDTLRKNYANLLRQIENLRAKYPEGTFDDIEREAREAGAEVRHLDTSSKTLIDNVDRLSGTYKKLNADLAQTKAEHQAEANAMKENTAASALLNNSLGSLVLQYVSIRAIISKVVSAFRDALNTMKEVDSALVTIQKTTGYTGQQLDRLTDSAYKLASAYGRTATEILNAASVYARAGFKDNLEDMTELSALLQNVGDLSSEAAAKFLIATNAAWQMDGSYKDLMGVIDGLNAQTNQAAVDMEALTSGITVAGSVFSNAGESVQTFAGLLGAGVALTTRSGSEIGRGLRTIAMNIRQIKGELDDGEIIDEASISDAAAALHSVGISVADANGELRLTSDVLTDLAGKWGSLTTAEQSYLSQSLAGKRQANILNALMNNWQEVERQMALYANGAGSAMQENEIYLDSWEAKTKQLNAAWTEFVANLVETDTIKVALDGLIALVNLLDSDFGHFLITATAIPTVLLTIASIAAKLTTAFTMLGAALTPILGIAAVGVGIAGIVALADALTTSAEEYADAVKEAEDAYARTKSQIEDLKKRENELTEIERKKLELLQEQEGIRLEELRKSKAAQYQNLYGDRDAALTANDLVYQYQSYTERIAKTGDIDELEKLEQGLENVRSKITTTLEGLKDFRDILGADFPQSGRQAIQTLEGFERTLDANQAKVQQTSEEWLEAGRKAFSWMLQTDGAAEAMRRLEERLKAVSEKATSYDTVISAVINAMENFGAESYEVNQAMKNLETIMPGSTAKMYDFDTATLLTKEDIFGSKAALLDFIDTQKQLEFSNAINQLEELAASYWDVAGAALAAMNAQAAQQMAGVLAHTGTDASMAQAGISSQLAGLKSEKAEWDAYVATLRARSSYKPDTTGRGSYTPVSSAPSSTADAELQRLQGIVSLEKAELTFLQASGRSLDEINAKRKVIQAALHDEAEYLRAQLEILKAEEVAEEDKAEHEAKIKALEEDILALSTEWWNIENNVSDDLAKAEEARKKQLEEEQKLLEEQKKLQQEMFDNLKSIVDDYYAKLISDKEQELSLEEKILAVQKAEADLANAQSQRTVRVFNAATGQWEWQANAKNVKSAQDALKKAQDDLTKYQRDMAWKEFKAAWEYVSEQIKAGAMTFQEAYDYMYAAMTRIQDTYGVDLSGVLDDSIGGFRTLNYGIDGLTQEVANSLGASVGVLNDRLREYENAVSALQAVFDEVSEKVKNGEMTMEDAYSYLRDRAKEIADKYGIDMTGALEEAIAGMDKTNMSIDELWKAVIINLMKVNSARWFDANDEEKALLHAQNQYLGNLIGATYDPSGYWYLNGSQLYGSQQGVDVSGKTGYGEATGGGSGGGVHSPSGTKKYYDSYGREYDTLDAAIQGNAAGIGGASGLPLVSGTGFLADPGKSGKLSKGIWGTHVKDAEGNVHWLDDSHQYFKDSNGYIYDANEATDLELAMHGLYRTTVGSGENARTIVTAMPEGSAPIALDKLLEDHNQKTGGGAINGLWGAMTALGNDDISISGGGYDSAIEALPASSGAISTVSTTSTSGDTYIMNGVSIGEAQAKAMTVFELADLSKTLGIAQRR